MSGRLPALGLALGLTLLLATCTVSPSRDRCSRDVDCGADRVCYWDGACAPIDVVVRQGGRVATECRVTADGERGCLPNHFCRMGSCVSRASDGGAP